MNIPEGDAYSGWWVGRDGDGRVWAGGLRLVGIASMGIFTCHLQTKITHQWDDAAM